ncbi:MAG: hypothetical protein KDD44_01405, partial [Bdellovibrionales bacterium]|nr:hypothetical protein [Bdellovibrionales bacterium]
MPLRPELAEYLEDKQAPEQFRVSLAALGDADQAVVEGLAQALRPSANALRELFVLAEETAARDGLPLAVVL